MLQLEIQSRATPKKGKTPKPLAEAHDVRDRIWTLYLGSWDILWRAGAYLFGYDQIDAEVPPLRAHVAHKTQQAPGDNPPATKPLKGAAKKKAAKKAAAEKKAAEKKAKETQETAKGDTDPGDTKPEPIAP